MTYHYNPNIEGADDLEPDPRQLAARIPRHPTGTTHTADCPADCPACIRARTLDDHAVRQSRRRQEG